MKRLVLISTFDFPTRYAHARHGLEMARAYHALLGEGFLMFVNTTLHPLSVPYRQLFGSFGRQIKKLGLRRTLLTLRLFFFFTLHAQWRHAIVVTTDPVLYVPLLRLKKIFGFTLVCECHGAVTAVQEKALQGADLGVFTTTWLRDRYALHTNLKSMVAQNAVDIDLFEAVDDDLIALRRELQLPQDIFLIGYIGRFEPLGHDKGLTFMIDALTVLSGDVHLLLLGGSASEVDAYHAYVSDAGLAARVHIVGHVDASKVPRYAKACDVLAYVPTEKSDFFEHETSPMKVFEYMAARRPIVLADTPAMREIANESQAFFVPQGDRLRYRSIVESLRDIPPHVQVANAFAAVRMNTWRARAQRIVHALDGML